ncbi:S9 family peptidase [Prolixibacteraceae bacterium JC049]|nr:S9 family peptidase [Prolixibacteraceae bacterium JC049]
MGILHDLIVKQLVFLSVVYENQLHNPYPMNFKRIITCGSLAIMGLGLFSAQAQDIDNWLLTGPVKTQIPAFAAKGDINFKKFERKNLLQSIKIKASETAISEGSTILLKNETFKWNNVTVPTDSLLKTDTSKDQLFFLTSYLETSRWQKGALTIESNAMIEIFVNGKSKGTKTSEEWGKKKVSLTLDRGKHTIGVRLLANNDTIKFHAKWKSDEDFEEAPVAFSIAPERALQISDIVDGKRLGSISISPSGKYAKIYRSTALPGGKSTGYYAIMDLATKKNIQIIRNPKIYSLKWLPTTDRLSYTTSADKKTNLYVYDPINGEEQLIAEGLKEFSGYSWAKSEQFIIYTQYKKAEKAKDLKRIYGPDDRLPYFRNRSYLRMLDVNSGTDIALTAGNLSTSLHDIHPTDNKILFSTSRMDYSTVPFRRQSLYQMNLNTFELDTIWKEKSYSGSAQYSPNGTQLLVQAGPECFGNIGVNCPKDMLTNAYDSQLYIFDLKSQKVTPITKKFDPSVDYAVWKTNNNIFVKVGERDFSNFYQFDVKRKRFTKIDIKTDVLSSMSIDASGQKAIYTGTSITTPNMLWTLDLKTRQSALLIDPTKTEFETIKLGKTEEWNFKNRNRETIYGRVYYPPNFDSKKKYPVIVYYYGGTSPVERNFGGRYPKNIWASAGYIVYVLQPSGATGFGQKFSARHVNGWGGDAIDDIIDGTKQFLKAHPAADGENVGCIGASYGGFTTMMLQTRTDIFKTAISHAGISDITSYWGEGYWGYTYSATASKNSYPWNNRELYVKNSPLFNADKFQNSILLLHGTSDTNVPVGESKQFYMALKLLNKDAEMVLVAGEDHWIINYKKRQQWHDTIMAWFSFKLKNQPEQWDEMYPKKQL